MFLCLGISLFMVLGFSFAKKLHTTLVVVSICTIVLITFSGIIPASAVLNKSANHDILLIAGMVVVSAGSSRTQTVNKLSNLVLKISKGGFGMQMLGYCVLAFLLTSLIPSSMAALGVMVPVIVAFCRRNGISPSKVMQPITLVCICSIGTAPFGSGTYTYATANSVTESYGHVDYVTGILDPVKGQLIISAILVVYAASIAPKLVSNQPPVLVTLGGFTNKTDVVDDAPLLDPAREVLGYGIFLLTTVGLILAGTLGLQSRQITVTGAVLITVVGVLKAQEAINTTPVPIVLMLVVAYAAGGAMEACGLGDTIGSLLASALGSIWNGYIIGFAFFIVPFLLTQFMRNFSADSLLQPIIITASKALSCNPVGLLSILGFTCNSVFMTSMSTGTTLPMMEADGYSQRDLLKMG